eukprot:SAG11_NODE_14852_length_597_cov_1.590361_1_plen_129_part_00
MVGPDPALFVVANADRYGIHHGVSSDRVRNVVGDVMRAAGVPAKFLPHSTRHAFLADNANRAIQQEAFLSQALMPGRVYELYYKCPIEQMPQHSAMVPVLVGNGRTDDAAAVVQLTDRRVSGATSGHG